MLFLIQYFAYYREILLIFSIFYPIINHSLFMNILYLASGSQARKEALEEAQIPFVVVSHVADERSCDTFLPFGQLLLSIARLKMAYVQLPAGKEGDCCFVLTADTMVQDMRGNVYGKPTDKKHALEMIRALRERGRVGTAFCLEQKKYTQGVWHTHQMISHFSEAFYELDLPDHWIERYLENKPDYLSIAGAIDVKGYGQQFIKRVEGCYGTVVSLPLFELRQALEDIGFFAL